MDAISLLNNSSWPTGNGNNIQLQPMFQQRELSKEENMYSQKKCKRCDVFYTEADSSGPCFYHPGTWVDSQTVCAGNLIGWSCCRVGERYGHDVLSAIPKHLELATLNTDSVEWNSKGCKRKEFHLEDREYSRNIQQFPFHPTEINLTNETAIENDKEIPQETPAHEQNEAIHQDIFKHPIQGSDTLVGLSLKYNVSVSMLQRINKLFDHQIYHLKYLLIPVDPKKPLPDLDIIDKERMLHNHVLLAFKNQTKSSNEEAKFYLEEADYSLEDALQLWKDDENWENNNSSMINQPASIAKPLPVEQAPQKTKCGSSPFC